MNARLPLDSDILHWTKSVVKYRNKYKDVTPELRHEECQVLEIVPGMRKEYISLDEWKVLFQPVWLSVPPEARQFHQIKTWQLPAGKVHGLQTALLPHQIRSPARCEILLCKVFSPRTARNSSRETQAHSQEAVRLPALWSE